MTVLRAMAGMYFIVIFFSVDLVNGREFLRKKTVDTNNPLKLEDIQLDSVDAPQVKPLGCYKDQAFDRAFKGLYKNMRGYSPSEVIMGCAKAAVENGFVYFGIQYGGECWGGKDGHLRYDMYGPADNCVNSIGTTWSNYVYRIEKVEGYCVYHFKFVKYNTLVDENNPCETCTCYTDGNVVCHHKTCPALPLSCEKKITLPGKCCPVCACYHNNIYYKNGDRWSWPLSNNGCEECYCDNNQAVCQIKVNCGVTTTAQPTIIIGPTTEEPVLTFPPFPGARREAQQDQNDDN